MTLTSPSRLLAVADIHGHAEGLRRLLREVHYRPGCDRLILLGDYITQEPGSWNSLRAVKQWTDEGAQALPGNVDLQLCRMAGLPDAWLPLANWVRSLPPYIVEDGILFVHAGVRPRIPLERQTLGDLTEIREEFWRADTGLPHTIVFGHTPTCKLGAPVGRIWQGARRYGIDTGAKHGQRLSLFDVKNGVVYSCSTEERGLYGDVRVEYLSRAEAKES